MALSTLRKATAGATVQAESLTGMGLRILFMGRTYYVPSR